ncbi:MAG: hypothetical protein UU23_C0001G0102 [Candidatus Curtissbacteria bacterium GW2011_GWA1_40_9]|uniref:Uncharacterized protein n=1 Tax=Candidatus Curtissbacteria bacterium GW2011_GWA1_40_9 TaxID=1618408 RepID=A0A0G0TMW6_9BACT|nr:MAG: hypothetical protein UU23_C0001G0102 [Candidatus Curtissbacteria bacterium GW2011_GWA1_40_9]
MTIKLKDTNNKTLNSQQSTKHLKKGFTLIELIMYMALMSIFLVVLSELFLSILEVRKESEATSGVEQDARYILSRLYYDLNRASSITTPATPGSSSSTLVAIISGDTNSYSASGGNLTLTNNAGTNNLNSSASSISNLNFQKIGASGIGQTVKIDFTLTGKTQRTGGAEIRDFTTTVGLR